MSICVDVAPEHLNDEIAPVPVGDRKPTMMTTSSNTRTSINVWIACALFLMGLPALGSPRQPVAQRRVMELEVEARLRAETGLKDRALLLLWSEGGSYSLDESHLATEGVAYRKLATSFFAKPQALGIEERYLLLSHSGIRDRDLRLRLRVAMLSDSGEKVRKAGISTLLESTYGIEEIRAFSDEIVAALAAQPINFESYDLLCRVQLPEALRNELLARRTFTTRHRAWLGDAKAQKELLAYFDKQLAAESRPGDELERLARDVALLGTDDACKALARGLSSPVIRDTGHCFNKAVAMDVLEGWLLGTHAGDELAVTYRSLVEKSPSDVRTNVNDPGLRAILERVKERFRAECGAEVVFRVPYLLEGVRWGD